MLGTLGNPFKLFGRLLLAGFKITGYTVTFIVQGVWGRIGKVDTKS